MSRKFFSGPFILILPSILAIGFVIIIPLIFSFYTSFTSYKLTRSDSLFNFVGLRNYERLIDNISDNVVKVSNSFKDGLDKITGNHSDTIPDNNDKKSIIKISGFLSFLTCLLAQRQL